MAVRSASRVGEGNAYAKNAGRSSAEHGLSSESDAARERDQELDWHALPLVLDRCAHWPASAESMAAWNAEYG